MTDEVRAERFTYQEGDVVIGEPVDLKSKFPRINRLRHVHRQNERCPAGVRRLGQEKTYEQGAQDH